MDLMNQDPEYFRRRFVQAVGAARFYFLSGDGWVVMRIMPCSIL
jgi:hypothetical protein